MSKISTEDFLAKYVDSSKFYTLKEVEDLMEDFSKENDGRVPSGAWMKVTNKLYQKMIIAEETFIHFGETDMFKLITHNMQPIFDEYNYKEDKPPLFGHTFAPIQDLLTKSAKVGYVSIFKYLVDNVKYNTFDIDRLNLYIAIKNNYEEILDIIIENTDENYGATGMIVHKIQTEILNEPALHTLSDEMKVKLVEHFEWMQIDTISGGISLDSQIKKWKKLSDSELGDLVYNSSKGLYNDKEFDTLKEIYKKRLQTQLEILERELELESM